MPRGQPDFGMYAQKTVGATLADMAELVARLDSIVTYDRRGDVVFLEDFEAPLLSWAPNVVDPDAYIRHDSTYVKGGAQALKIHTTNTASEEKRAIKSLSLLGSKRLGLEASFSNLDANCAVVLRIWYRDGTHRWEAALKYDPIAKILYVQDDSPAWVEVAAGLSVVAIYHFYYTLKLVADFETTKYVRLLFANVEYDISTISLYDLGGPVDARTEFILALLNRNATGGDIWYDNVIGTQNEP